MNTRLAIVGLAILAAALVVGVRAHASSPVQGVQDVEVRRYIETQLRPYLNDMRKQLYEVSRKVGVPTGQGEPVPAPHDGAYPGMPTPGK